MKFNKEIIKKAHEMTKEIKNQYADVDYKTQFGLCLSYLLKNEEDMKMVELKGTEKQIKWAEKIRETMIKHIDFYKSNFNSAGALKKNYFFDFKEEIMSFMGKEKINTTEATESLNNIIDTAWDNLTKETSSKFFIEHREETTVELIKKFL
ncbi:hypothetical protein [Clostridium brassicae]|uniref:Uncharacterized protein n=1 Tax=Clostridium brassicae TaxID=2999072 RepID=A0ABT4D847_9CLOT|nr:hypothetical protein [Clostridium brassicae]MCY6957843.1 hypothetical protein [Clostridium brassicae]